MKEPRTAKTDLALSTVAEASQVRQSSQVWRATQVVEATQVVQATQVWQATQVGNSGLNRVLLEGKCKLHRGSCLECNRHHCNNLRFRL